MNNLFRSRLSCGLRLTSTSSTFSNLFSPGPGQNVPSQFHQLLFFSTKAGSKEHLTELVKKSKVVVFMKGVPEEPKCGFSNAVVQVLRMHGVNSYDSYDVLKDENIRQGIKDFTNWPTIPQIFIDGEFVGGCDILVEMHKNGELIETLKKAGLKSALVDVKVEEPKK